MYTNSNAKFEKLPKNSKKGSRVSLKFAQRLAFWQEIEWESFYTQRLKSF